MCLLEDENSTLLGISKSWENTKKRHLIVNFWLFTVQRGLFNTRFGETMWTLCLLWCIIYYDKTNAEEFASHLIPNIPVCLLERAVASFLKLSIFSDNLSEKSVLQIECNTLKPLFFQVMNIYYQNYDTLYKV